MDGVFRALADPTRRSLLDELFKQDGQTLSALERRLPMTRFGVMKHLRVLEEAGLIVTRRRGREKLHFLNAVPIRLVHDRWVSKYAAPWAATLSDGPRRITELAELEGLAQPTTTILVKQLERQGLVRRERQADDALHTRSTQSFASNSASWPRRTRRCP